jgi:hypothetical protein
MGTTPIANGSDGNIIYNSGNTVSEISTGDRVVTAIGVDTNIAGGLLVAPAVLTSNAIVLGGGSGLGPKTTATGTGVVSVLGNSVNAVGGIITAASSLTANNLIIGQGTGTGMAPTTTGVGVLTALSNQTNTTNGIVTQSAVLTANNIVLSGGSGGIKTTTTGTGVVTALGIAVNAAGGLVTTPVTLTNHAILLGGGAGNGIGILSSLGTNHQVLHGNASGDPTWSAVDLTADVSGILPVANGGTNKSSWTAGKVVFTGTGGTSLNEDVALQWNNTNKTLTIGTTYSTDPGLYKSKLSVDGATTFYGPVRISTSTNPPAFQITNIASLSSGGYIGENLGGHFGSLSILPSGSGYPGKFTWGTRISSAYVEAMSLYMGTAGTELFIGYPGTYPGSLALASSGGSYVYLRTAGNSAYSLTLPVDDGLPNQILLTDGSGILSWSNAVTSVGLSFTTGAGHILSNTGTTSPITTVGTYTFAVTGTSGGIPYFDATDSWNTSALLAANAVMLGGGAGTAPKTTTTGTGVVTAIGINTNTAGGLLVAPAALALDALVLGGGSGTGPKTTTTGTGVVTALGIAVNATGGIITTAVTLTDHAILIGNGAGAGIGVLSSLGTTTTVLHGNASGDPTWGSVVLTTDVSGILPVANGGTNKSSWTAGSVVFAGASGTSLTQDNTNFFWDDANNRLGIGTATPSTPLYVLSGTDVSSGTDTITNAVATFVGPTRNFNTTGNPALFQLIANTPTGTDLGPTVGFAGRKGTAATSIGQLAIIKAAFENNTVGDLASYLAFGTRIDSSNVLERMRINSTGKVGIANINPSALLTLGTAGTAAGTLSLAGSSSGVVTIQTAAAAGTWSLTLPANDGNNLQVLMTDGNGITTWSDSVTSVGLVSTTGTAQVLTVTVDTTNPITTQGTFTLNVTGNKGGINYFDSTSSWKSSTTSQLVYDDTNYRLGIGTATPSTLLHVQSGTDNTSGTDYITDAVASIVGPTRNFNAIHNPALLQVTSNSAFAADAGATIGLGGRTTTSSTQIAQFAVIKGAKENATSTNKAGYLAFGTRSAITDAYGSTTTTDVLERLRISSIGKVGIANTSPTDLLTLGTAGVTPGVISFAGATSGRVKIDVPSTTTDWILTLPDAVPTLDNFQQALFSDISGNTEWHDAVRLLTWTGGLVTITDPSTLPKFTIAGNTGGIVYFDTTASWKSSTASQLVYDDTNHRLGIGNATPSALLSLGTAGTLAGTLSMAGSSAGTVTVTTPATITNWTLTLPPTKPTISSQLFVGDTSGNATWTAAASYTAGTIILGVVGTQGNLTLAGTTSGTVTVTTPATVTDWSLTLPATKPTINRQLFVADTNGAAQWTPAASYAAGAITLGITGTVSKVASLGNTGSTTINMGLSGVANINVGDTITGLANSGSHSGDSGIPTGTTVIAVNPLLSTITISNPLTQDQLPGDQLYFNNSSNPINASPVQGSLKIASYGSGLVTVTTANNTDTWTLTLPTTKPTVNRQLFVADTNGAALWTPAASYASGAITVGVVGTQGSLKIAGTTSGTVTITTLPAAGTYTLTLPPTDGDNLQTMLSDGSGVLFWHDIITSVGLNPSTGTAGIMTVSVDTTNPITTQGVFTLNVAGNKGGITYFDSISSWKTSTASQLVYDDTNYRLGIGNATPGALLSLGTAGTKAGTLSMAGSSAGTVTVTTPATITDWTLTLPPTKPTIANQLFVGDTSGNATWTPAASYLAGIVTLGMNGVFTTTSTSGISGNSYFTVTSVDGIYAGNLVGGYGIQAGTTVVSTNSLQVNISLPLVYNAIGTYSFNNSYGVQGGLKIAGLTNGLVTVTTANTTDTWTLTLPTAKPTVNRQLFVADTNGAALWTPAASYASGAIILGVVGTQGSLKIAGTTAGTVTVTTPATVTDWTLTLPAAKPTIDRQLFVADTNGTTIWTPAASYASGAITLGVVGTQGSLKLAGTTSGTVTLTTAAAAGTYTLTLPTTDGDNLQTMLTDGSGVLSWHDIVTSVGLNPSTGTAGIMTVSVDTTNPITTQGTFTLNVSGNKGGITYFDSITSWKSSTTSQLVYDDTNYRLGIGNATPSALLSLGTAGTLAGTLSMAGSSAGTVTVATPATITNWTLTLPPTKPTIANQLFVGDTNGNATWTAAASYTAGTIILGVVGTQGNLKLAGTTAGTITLTTPATVTDYTITLPSVKPTISNQFFVANTSGDATWTAAASYASGAIILGVVGTQGSLKIAGTTAGTVTVTTPATVTDWTLTLPATKPTVDRQLLVADTNGAAIWTPAASYAAGALKLGVVGTQGSLVLAGTTAGTVTVTVPINISAPWTLTLPVAKPAKVNQVIVGDTDGVTSWADSVTSVGLVSTTGTAQILTVTVDTTNPITTTGTFTLNVSGTSGGIPYFNSSSGWNTSAVLATASVVLGGGAGSAPYSTTTGTGVVTAIGQNVTGTSGGIVIANNPTMTLPNINNVRLGYTSTVTSSTPVVLTKDSNYSQIFTGSTAQTITLPDVTTLVLGQGYYIMNNSSAILTVQSSGSNTVTTVIPSTTVYVICIAVTGTTAGSWDYDYTGFAAITGTGNNVLSANPTINGTSTSITNVGTFALRDTSAAYDLTIAAVSSTALTAGRTLTVDVVNGSRTLKIGGNVTIGDTFNTVGTFSSGGNFSTAGAFSVSGAYSTALTITTATALTLPSTGYLLASANPLYGSTGSGIKTITGTPDSTSFLRGDGVWQVVALPNAGTTGQLAYYSSSTAIDSTPTIAYTSGKLAIGIAGTTMGQVSLAGSTSGIVTIDVAAAAGTWAFTLPTSGGTANYFMRTDGSGNASWTSLTVDDTATNSTHYPVMVDAAGGTVAKTSSTNFQINPNTGAALIKGNIYTQGRVGMNDSSNISKVYQYYNSTTDSLDTVFG